MKNVKKKYSLIIIAVVIALALTQCAKRGSPTGGPVDETPPEILRAFPDNYSVNFKNQEIEITFDEYVKLKDLQKQLVISPPLKYRPIIKPQGGASKKLTIEITDTLLDNTTYVLNFGQSIIDNTEENPYPFFKYVFSTGSYIDSLKIQGRVTDALKFKTDDFINVMLYEVNDSYTDSIIYNEVPRYVVNTLDSLTTFTMENLKAGQYRMVALKEKSSNLKFDPKSDKLGFVSEVITVPTDEVFEVNLYEPEQNLELRRASQVAQSRIQIGYEGLLDSAMISPVNKSLIAASRITKADKKDTLNYWYKPVLEQDSLELVVALKEFKRTVTARLKEQEKDSLIVSKYGQFSLRNPIQFTATTPIVKLSPLQMRLIDKDSVSQDFAVKLDSLNNIWSYEFNVQPENKYSLQSLPGAVTDFYGATNDTITSVFTTKASSDLGNIPINLSGGTAFPIIVQIVTENLEVTGEIIVRDNKSVTFDYLPPNKYYIRVIYDANDNGRFDPGNFLENRQPEKVVYFPDLIALQANWDYVTNIILE
ncbi:Ig-like domain-containing protein [Nonlabens antarcticus]|uniref:Ig-like domain-containing protein n=1 Tax=Nonlabens antarcticus TaxID=392714 RepID=UPI001E4BC4C9|nr:Ig-like domain-containing protein [Nonlabens antarcticus]